MTNVLLPLIGSLLIASAISGCTSNTKQAPVPAWDYRTLEKISNKDQLVIARAAIAVSELTINHPSSYPYALGRYFSLPPEIYRRENAGKAYVLVVFREENSKHNGAAYALMQSCSGRLYDIEYGFGAKIDRSLIAGFLAPIGASGPDYLELNLCETGEL